MKRWYHKMMDPLHYLHLQLRLEGMEIVKERFIRQIEVVSGEEVPLMLTAHLASEVQVSYYEETIKSELQESLASAIGEVRFPNIDPLLCVLKKQNMQVEVGHYKTYVFVSSPVKAVDVLCLSKDDARVKAFGFDGFTEQVYVIEREGSVVSACVSARENEMCGEAWVFTSPEDRHKGLAQNVVNAWAESLIRAGKVPFYSHKFENQASANLARSLNLQPIFEEIVITRTTYA